MRNIYEQFEPWKSNSSLETWLLNEDFVLFNQSSVSLHDSDWLQVKSIRVWMAFSLLKSCKCIVLTCSNALVNWGNPALTNHCASHSPSRINDKDVSLLIFYGKKRFNKTFVGSMQKIHKSLTCGKVGDSSLLCFCGKTGGANCGSTEWKPWKNSRDFYLRMDPRPSRFSIDE